MLVLTRKKEEVLHIGTDITVTVLKVKGNSVQLGIQAPKSVKVLRGELIVCESQETSTVKRRPSESAREMLGANRLRELTAQVKGESKNDASLMQLV